MLSPITRRALLFSLAGHGVLFLCFALRLKQDLPRPPANLVVHLEASSPLLPSASAKIAKSGKGKGLSAGRRLQLHDLAPKINAGESAARISPAPATTEASAEMPSLEGSKDWFGAKAPAKERGALHWVYQQTENNLAYPKEFIRHEIEGRVLAFLVFHADGQLDQNLLRVRSDSPYLKVYLQRMLERTFNKNPIPKDLRNWENKLAITSYVNFAFRESAASVTLELPQSIVGRNLYFSRTKVKSKLAWNLGPLHGVGPIPAVGVDVLWFARQAKEIVKPSLPVDDLAPYREDPLFRN